MLTESFDTCVVQADLQPDLIIRWNFREIGLVQWRRQVEFSWNLLLVYIASPREVPCQINFSFPVNPLKLLIENGSDWRKVSW